METYRPLYFFAMLWSHGRLGLSGPSPCDSPPRCQNPFIPWLNRRRDQEQELIELLAGCHILEAELLILPVLLVTRQHSQRHRDSQRVYTGSAYTSIQHKTRPPTVI
jgi:hypothetical protein